MRPDLLHGIVEISCYVIHLYYDCYMLLFTGKFSKKKKRNYQLSVRLNKDSFFTIKAVQKQLGWSQSDIIEVALNLFSIRYSDSKKPLDSSGEMDADRVRY